MEITASILIVGLFLVPESAWEPLLLTLSLVLEVGLVTGNRLGMSWFPCPPLWDQKLAYILHKLSLTCKDWHSPICPFLLQPEGIFTYLEGIHFYLEVVEEAYLHAGWRNGLQCPPNRDVSRGKSDLICCSWVTSHVQPKGRRERRATLPMILLQPKHRGDLLFQNSMQEN